MAVHVQTCLRMMQRGSKLWNTLPSTCTCLPLQQFRNLVVVPQLGCQVSSQGLADWQSSQNPQLSAGSYGQLGKRSVRPTIAGQAETI
jgi:hypothetical protein